MPRGNIACKFWNFCLRVYIVALLRVLGYKLNIRAMCLPKNKDRSFDLYNLNSLKRCINILFTTCKIVRVTRRERISSESLKEAYLFRLIASRRPIPPHPIATHPCAHRGTPKWGSGSTTFRYRIPETPQKAPLPQCKSVQWTGVPPPIVLEKV